MGLPASLGNIRKYTSNENWFYAASPLNYDREKQCSEWHVYRGEITDEYEPRPYVREANTVMGKNVLVFPCFRMNTMYSREDIDAAEWTPLRFLELMSEDMQNRISWKFPVRKDSFERYLADSYLSAESECPEFDVYYGEYLQKATQEDFDTIRNILDSAVYRYAGSGYSSNPLRIILEEEAQMYYAGDATLEETVKKIQSRATLWLNEL